MTTELLKWHAPESDMPDAETAVLLWIGIDLAAGADWTAWAAGWWDGEDWRLAESGGVCASTVVAWAEPEGPKP